MRKITFIIIFALLLFCAKNDNPITTRGKKSSFGFYFLKDTLKTEQDIKSMAIDQLELNYNPWLTDQNLEFYDFSSHCLYLKQDKSHFFKNFGGRYYHFDPPLMSRPFVLVVENERCYIGAFHSGLLSTAPMKPYMDEMDVGHYPPDLMHISRGWDEKIDDRNNLKLKEALKILKLYHGGLEIELTSLTSKKLEIEVH